MPSVCMYVCMYVCIMYVCMYVHTYIRRLLPKGGRPAARRADGRPVTNFPNRICINKGSCKKSAHLDLKWGENGCLKFLLVVGGWINKNYNPNEAPKGSETLKNGLSMC